jgi:hypothetical protein
VEKHHLATKTNTFYSGGERRSKKRSFLGAKQSSLQAFSLDCCLIKLLLSISMVSKSIGLNPMNHNDSSYVTVESDPQSNGKFQQSLFELIQLVSHRMGLESMQIVGYATKFWVTPLSFVFNSETMGQR